MEKTYWQGALVVARRVRVRIGTQMPPSYWCAPLAGAERDALEVHTSNGVILIDDHNGVGMAVLTRMYAEGGYRRLPPDSVVLSER